MTAPDERRDPTDATARASDEPVVSTAPAAAAADAGAPTGTTAAPRHRWWSAVPKHLGRARTSTVVLAVLFVSVFALYLNVKPPAPGEPDTRGQVTEQAEETEPVTTEETEPTTTEETEPAPTTTSRPSTPTTDSPSPTTEPTTTAPETTGPEPTGDTGGTGDETDPASPTG
ncbi:MULTISPECIES: hypothetical protein [unclassified Blastococcus]